jgi:hypothetical protein
MPDAEQGTDHAPDHDDAKGEEPGP